LFHAGESSLFASQGVTLHVWSLSLLAIGLVLAIVIEYRSDKIPNWLTLVMALGGVGLALYDGAWGLHLLGFLTAFGLGIFGWLLGSTKAGFAKLLAAVGATTNPLFAVILVACVFAFGVAFRLFAPSANDAPTSHRQPRPYTRGSVVLAAGTLVTVGIFEAIRRFA
jgi:Flp pilus assembly protein protease CpaA